MKLLDTSPISLFILEIPDYDFLTELYEANESLNITNYVKNEFKETGNMEKLEEYLDKGIINLENIDYNQSLKVRYPFLGNGELSIIQGGLNLKDSCFYQCIIDDLAARRVAEKLNLTISGSVGLLILLKNKNLYSKDKIDEIIESIDKSNFHISK